MFGIFTPKKKTGGDDLTEEVKMFKNGVKF